ncbi:TlyA family RNA methyltransferase [Deferribacter autotrophicus]|uniref:TlyA family RNA methyltransferase n=1 Tax=Deferribacter autotrophicus TaxID=500465 RepID=A0A5A8F573_9BACT|nr:TlyA family RNA methyltransferase [Deferribacter autotrophicus]KAA0259162.1 TlyA family RNA methyltransferase [Deferribacter autotrophicus]
MGKDRLDKILVSKKLVESREKAQRLIMAGLVFVNNEKIEKPGTKVDEDAEIFIKETLPYVSKGGLKLEKAVKVFNLNFKDKTVLDIGASTGGFTDVALKNGAKKVYAVDVGRGQLHYSLRINPKVINIEKCNFRYIEFEQIGEKVDIITSDVSFISLTLIIPKTIQFCKEKSEFIVLIKPQFEAGREQVGKKGVVRNTEVHKDVIKKIIDCAETNGYKLKGLAKSPIKGAKGNTEYLAYFVYSANFTEEINYDDLIERAINE